LERRWGVAGRRAEGKTFNRAGPAQKVTALAQALEHPETRTEASEALRGLIDAIVLMPKQGELQIELKGNLAAMLGAAQNAKRSPETGDLSLQIALVAGAGFEPATFGL
jgi:site-specific DNA recombinase